MKKRKPIAKSRLTNWPMEISLLLIPSFFVLLQGWATQRIAIHLFPAPLFDARLYLTQALNLQHDPVTLRSVLEFGFYPLFLSQFDLGIRDWLTASNDPKLLAIYYVQSLILCATSAVFLFCALILTPGHLLKRIVVAVLLGCILLSPLIIVWPNYVLTESMVLPATLLFACGCLADDAGRRWSLILIAMSCLLLVLVRDAMILFVCMFVTLLLANILFAKINWTRPRMIGTVLVLLALGLGIAKESLVVNDSEQYTGTSKTLSTLFANVIQYRILPNPEYRKFFVERELPISSTVMERVGKPAWVDSDWFQADSDLSDRPDLVAYRHWVVTKGTRTYLTFLLAHPEYLLRSIVNNPNEPDERFKHFQDIHFSMLDLLSVPYNGYSTRLAPYPNWLTQFLLAPFGWLIPLLYLFVAAIRYIWQTTIGQRASSLDIAAIAAWGTIFANYHIDAWGIWPHAVPSLLLIYIVLITGTVEIAIRFANARIGLPRAADTIARKCAGEITEVSTLFSTGTRLNTTPIVTIAIVCAGVAWISYPSQVGSPTAETFMRQVTDISELPPLPEFFSTPIDWDFIEGLNAEALQGSPMVRGWHILRLIAVNADGRFDTRHALGARFRGLTPNGVYRTIAWVKAKPDVRVMMAARDFVSNEGVAQFNPAAHSVVNSTGDILASGVEADAEGWMKLRIDLRSQDGQVFVVLGLLENRNGKHIFKAARQEVTFGGFEISPHSDLIEIPPVVGEQRLTE